MLSESIDGQELLAPLSFSQHSKRLQSARERVSLTQLPGQELPEGDLVQGGVARCSKQVGHSALCWKVGWEAGQAMWDMAIAFLWLQDDRGGQRNAPVCPQQPVTSLVSL